MLGRLKYTFEEVREAILTMSDVVLSESLVKSFLAFVPTQEETSALSKIKTIENVAKSDLFLIEMLKIPRYEYRLRCMAFRYGAEDRFASVLETLDNITSGCKALKNSENFQKLLEIILLIGNYMNSTGFKGKAHGFKISNINRLVDTKTSDNSMTLLAYLSLFISEKEPGILNFIEELKPITNAVRGTLF